MLDELLNSAPNGAILTRAYIRGRKHPCEEAEQDGQKAERRRQIEDQRTALQNLCRQQERQTQKLIREKEEREQKYTGLCHSVGKEPEPFPPPLPPENEPSLTVAEDLDGPSSAAESTRLRPRSLKKAIDDFVPTVLAQRQ